EALSGKGAPNFVQDFPTPPSHDRRVRRGAVVAGEFGQEYPANGSKSADKADLPLLPSRTEHNLEEPLGCGISLAVVARLLQLVQPIENDALLIDQAFVGHGVRVGAVRAGPKAAVAAPASPPMSPHPAYLQYVDIGVIGAHYAPMPKVNVYLPDELAAAVKETQIPVAAVCQAGLG